MALLVVCVCAGIFAAVWRNADSRAVVPASPQLYTTETVVSDVPSVDEHRNVSADRQFHEAAPKPPTYGHRAIGQQGTARDQLYDTAASPPFSLKDIADADLLKVDGVGVGPLPGQVDLRGATLRRASLANVDLAGVEVSHADLSHADLRNANLGGRFHEVDFTGADLAEADLRAGNFSFANFTDADMRGVQAGPLDTQRGRIVANFAGADLRDADLRGARLGGASLLQANLASADLRGADLRGALHLRRADLRGALYDRATMFDAGFLPGDAGMILEQSDDQ